MKLTSESVQVKESESQVAAQLLDIRDCRECELLALPVIVGLIVGRSILDATLIICSIANNRYANDS